jgi:hypothetical protein
MSFVDLLGDHVWTETDIVNRTEAMVRAVTPVIQQQIITRKVTAALIGKWELTPAEKAENDAYEQACIEAHQAGQAARRDMALLQRAFNYERAALLLSVPPADDADQMDVEQAAAARDAAEAIVDAADDELLQLVARRAARFAPAVPVNDDSMAEVHV